MRKNLLHILIIAIFIMGTHSIAKPFFADYHYRRAINIEGTQWPEAIASYRKAINLDPSNAAYHAKLGHRYLNEARSTASRLTVNRSPSKITGQRTTVNGQRPPVSGERTTDNSQQSTLQNAAASFQKAIELCPNNGNYWLGLGMVYEQLGKFKAQSSKLKAPSTTHDSPFIIHHSRSTDNSQRSPVSGQRSTDNGQQSTAVTPPTYC